VYQICSIPYLDSISRAWCKNNVTTSFYIRSYNSFAPNPRYAVLISWLRCDPWSPSVLWDVLSELFDSIANP